VELLLFWRLLILIETSLNNLSLIILGKSILEVIILSFLIHSSLDKCLSVLVWTICSPIYFLLLNKFLIVPSFQTVLLVFDEETYFHYDSAKVFLNIDFDKFINELKSGNIQFDIRIGVHKSGPNYGKPHDHGSGFRVKKENLINLYNNSIDL